MECPDVSELELYVRGEAGEGERRDVGAHLSGCVSCRHQAEEIERNLELEPPLRDALRRGSQECLQAVLPRRIGSYRIQRELGRGGMGVVYLAEQDHPRREVALKVIRPAAATSQMLRRIEHEANVLAQLQHPGIAQVYDAGIAEVETGRGPGDRQPYFAMEYVAGVPLLEYVDGHDCGVRERLDLLAQICDAVHHAHLKGVIHRDLKPGNVLVTESGQPKVLDFGAARVTDADVQTVTMPTDAARLIGTVPYMSPEQVAGDATQLDARSDVYALGVVGFELLAGRLPYPLAQRSIPEAVHIIREHEPSRLSTVRSECRGDIETIIGTALEKDRERRYQSAAEMAADLRRYLGNEPILARPPSTLYQLRKFARRNRPFAAAILALFLVLAGATAASSVLAARAVRAEARAQESLAEAEAEAAKYQAISTFLEDMLASANPEVSPDQPAMTVRQALDEAAEEIAAGAFGTQPGIEVALRTTIGNAYRSIGEFQSAETQLRAAVNLGREVHPDGDADLALAMHKLARVLEATSRFDECERLNREALEMRRAIFEGDHPDIATSLNNLGYVLFAKGQYEEAEKRYREALAMRRRLYGEEHEEIANSLNNIGLLMHRQSRLEEAEPLYRRSLEMDREIRGELHPNVAGTMSNLATLLNRQGRRDEAERLYREALELRHRMYGPEHPEVSNSLNNLSFILKQQERYEEAEQMLRQSLAMERRFRGDTHPEVANRLNNLASLLLEAGGETGEIEELYREALEINRQAYDEPHVDLFLMAYQLGSFLLKEGRIDEAEPLLAEATGVRDLLPEHPYAAFFLRKHGQCLLRQARYEEAEETLLEAHTVCLEALGPEHDVTRATREHLAELYQKTGGVRGRRMKDESAPGA